MFVFPAGVVLLIFPKIRWKRLAIWLGVAVAGLAVYFINYKSPKRHGSLLGNILEHGDQMLLYPFAFVGSSLKSVFEADTSIIIAGMVLVIFALWMLVKKWRYFISNPLLISYLVFLALLIGASSVSRGYRGYDAAFYNRYQLMHILTLGLIYLSAVSAFPTLPKRTVQGIVGLSVLLYIVRMADYVPKILGHKEQLECSLLAYHAGRVDDINSLPLKPQPVVVQRFDLAIGEATYSPPEHILPEAVIYDTSKLEAKKKAVVAIDIYEDTKKGLVIHGKAFINGYKKRTANQKIYFILKSDDENYLIPARKFRHYEPRSIGLLKQKEDIRVSGTPKISFPSSSAFSFILPKKKIDLPKGKYKLSILIEQNTDIKAIRKLDKTVVF